MNMNCCGNDYSSSEILTKEVDLSNKESVLKKRKELEEFMTQDKMKLTLNMLNILE